MKVLVAHALPGRQAVVELELDAGATAADAVAASGLGGAGGGLGIAGRRVPPDRVLADGDRVDLLRPLAADPNEARRRRARKPRR